MTDLEPGSRLGRYRIEAVVGRGGMGVVYRALQDGLERQVALKVIAAHLAEDPDFRARFEREAKLAASLDHPNVVPVFEAGEHDSALFLAMRFVRGEDLATIVRRDGPLRAVQASAILTQVAAALDAAHDAGLVHRDVKPHNILLSGSHAYLTDFGLTKSTKSATAITRTGAVLGSIDYAAPEQLLGDPTDRRSDVYSLACTSFHLIAGAPPFERPSDTARMLAHLTDPPPDLPDALPPLSGAIKQGMAKTPEERFATAGDFARACAAAVADAASAATTQRTIAASPPAAGPTVPASPPRSPGRRRGLAAGGVVAVLALVAVAALVLSGGSDTEDTVGSTPTPTPVAAAVPGGNLTVNPSFETGLESWDVSGSQLSRVQAPDAPDGQYVVRVAQKGAPGEYAIDDTPDSVEQSVAGRTYVATAWVKATEATDGDGICIGLRERTAEGKPIGQAYVGAPASADEYRQIRVAYAAQRDGSQVDVHVFGDSPDGNPDDAFLADAISMTEGSGRPVADEC